MAPPPPSRRGGLRTLAAVAAGAATAVTAVRLYRSWIERLDEESGHTCVIVPYAALVVPFTPECVLPGIKCAFLGCVVQTLHSGSALPARCDSYAALEEAEPKRTAGASATADRDAVSNPSTSDGDMTGEPSPVLQVALPR